MRVLRRKIGFGKNILRDCIATSASSLGRLIKPTPLKTILWIVLIGLAFLFLGYSVYTNWSQLSQYEWRADFRFLLLSFILYPASLLPLLWGWHWIMSRLGGISDFGTNAEIYCYSCLPKHIPGVIWYVAGRVHLYTERGVTHYVALLGTLLETMLLIVSGSLIYLLSLPFIAFEKGFDALRVSPALLITILLGITLHPAVFNRVLEFLSKKLKCPTVVDLTRRDVFILLLIYLGAWIVGGTIFYLLANAVYAVPVSQLPALIGICAASCTVSSIAAFILSGLGTREIALSLLLSGYMPLSLAIVISLLFRILLIVGEVFWALVLARLLR